MKDTKGDILFGVMVFLVMGTIFAISKYYTLNPENFFPEQRDNYSNHLFAFACHVFGGSVALLLGPLQFRQGFRHRHPKIHQTMGKLYTLGVVVGGLGGMRIALLAYGGLPSRLALGTLAVCWLITITMAVKNIHNGNTALHRQWMIRNYALTFGAVTLRIYTTLYGVLSAMEITAMPLVEAYVAITWFAWVPNLIIAEWVILGRVAREKNSFSRYTQQTLPGELSRE